MHFFVLNTSESIQWLTQHYTKHKSNQVQSYKPTYFLGFFYYSRTRSTSSITCYGCRQLSHIATDYPSSQFNYTSNYIEGNNLYKEQYHVNFVDTSTAGAFVDYYDTNWYMDLKTTGYVTGQR